MKIRQWLMPAFGGLKIAALSMLLVSFSNSAYAGDRDIDGAKAYFENCAYESLMYAKLVSVAKQYQSEAQFHAVIDPTVPQNNAETFRWLVNEAWVTRDQSVVAEGIAIYRSCVSAVGK